MPESPHRLTSAEEPLGDALADIAKSLAWIARLGEYTPMSSASTTEGVTLDRAQYLILEYLNEQELTGMAELSKLLGVHISSVSREIAKLETAALIKRRRSSENHRANHVEITDKGRRELKAIRAARAATARLCMDGWPAPEIEALSSMLTRYVDSLASLYDEGVLPA